MCCCTAVLKSKSSNVYKNTLGDPVLPGTNVFKNTPVLLGLGSENCFYLLQSKMPACSDRRGNETQSLKDNMAKADFRRTSQGRSTQPPQCPNLSSSLCSDKPGYPDSPFGLVSFQSCKPSDLI